MSKRAWQKQVDKKKTTECGLFFVVANFETITSQPLIRITQIISTFITRNEKITQDKRHSRWLTVSHMLSMVALLLAICLNMLPDTDPKIETRN